MDETRKHKILVVDDETIIRESTAMLLTAAGYDVGTAEHGFDALLQIKGELPDLIISDYRLPEGRTADDVVAAFSRRWSEPIPVLVLTGEVATSGALTARDRTLFLKKPAAPEAFIAAIHQLCFSPGHPPEPAATVPDATPPRSG